MLIVSEDRERDGTPWEEETRPQDMSLLSVDSVHGCDSHNLDQIQKMTRLV